MIDLYYEIDTTCDVQKREKSEKSGDLLEDIKAILIYSELLHEDLEFCRGKKGSKDESLLSVEPI